MKVYTPPIMTLHRRTGWQFSEWSECHSDHNGNCIQSRFVQCMHSQERASMFFLKFQSKTLLDFRDFSFEIFKSRFRSPRFRNFSFGIFSGFSNPDPDPQDFGIFEIFLSGFSGFFRDFKMSIPIPGLSRFSGFFDLKI